MRNYRASGQPLLGTASELLPDVTPDLKTDKHGTPDTDFSAEIPYPIFSSSGKVIFNYQDRYLYIYTPKIGDR